MPLMILRQDITKMDVDAIVNAANPQLAMGGGVCGAIFHAAGASQLQAACRKIGPIHTGDAVITPGFALPANYIIHTAGPVYSAYSPAESEKLLRSAYTESLKLALKNQCESIAFPLISSGIYGYPKENALKVAVASIRNFLAAHDMQVYLVIFDRDSFAVSKELVGAVESYIDENYIADYSNFLRRDLYSAPFAVDQAVSSKGLDDLIGHMDEPFNTTLLRLIDSKGKTDSEIYKRANIDRKLFSKIRNGKDGYMPSKKTVLALAVALELNLKETDDLLERAGYALSHSRKFDVIVEYFIVSQNYDIFEINEVLFKYDQPLLGAAAI